MEQHPDAWHADPTGRNELRYFAAGQWTDHVSNGGVQSTDPVGPSMLRTFEEATTFGDSPTPEKIAAQLARAGVAGGAGQPAAFAGASLFDQPVLVVNQKAKVIEMSNQYSIFDQHGNRIGAVEQVGQGVARKALRLLTNVDQFLTHRLAVHDASGAVLLRLTRPAKVFKSTVVVERPDGTEIGRIAQANVFGKIRFDFVVGGQTIGGIQAKNWRAWNFQITDAAGQEVANITKTWGGILKAAFTTADNYVVNIHRTLPEPLNYLVVAAAVSVDTALKQDDR